MLESLRNRLLKDVKDTQFWPENEEGAMFEPKIDSVNTHRIFIFIYRWIALIEIFHLLIRYNVRF